MCSGGKDIFSESKDGSLGHFVWDGWRQHHLTCLRENHHRRWSPQQRSCTGLANCVTNRQYKCPGKSFFRFPRDEARKAIDFWLSSTVGVRLIARPLFVFQLFEFCCNYYLLIIFFNYVTWSAPSSLFTVQLCGINHLCFSKKNIFGGGDSQLRVQKSTTYLMVLPQKMISLAHGCMFGACVCHCESFSVCVACKGPGILNFDVKLNFRQVSCIF